MTLRINLAAKSHLLKTSPRSAAQEIMIVNKTMTMETRKAVAPIKTPKTISSTASRSHRPSSSTRTCFLTNWKGVKEAAWIEMIEIKRKMMKEEGKRQKEMKTVAVEIWRIGMIRKKVKNLEKVINRIMEVVWIFCWSKTRISMAWETPSLKMETRTNWMAVIEWSCSQRARCTMGNPVVQFHHESTMIVTDLDCLVRSWPIPPTGISSQNSKSHR